MSEPVSQEGGRTPADGSPTLPSWLANVDSSLAVRAQVVLWGNVRDHYLLGDGAQRSLQSMASCIWTVLEARGYEFMAIADPIDGIGIFPDTPTHRARAAEVLPVKLDEGRRRISLEGLRDCLERLPANRSRTERGEVVRFGFVVDFASRLARDPEQLTPEEHALFAFAQKLSHMRPVPVGNGQALYNQLLWLVEREHDLPSWLTAGNESIRSIAVPLPEKDERRDIAEALAPRFPGHDDLGDEQRRDHLADFADATAGLPTHAMIRISRLATHQRIGLDDVTEAVRGYKFGVLENPWRRPGLRGDLAGAEAALSERVIGQPQAVRKACDILLRSATGLSGAQAAGQGTRPRGVLFLAGPTGVGKTELAKSLTGLVFGDEEAYHRFDMSEYSSEHAEARLVGAPPGYIGYAEGGQLTDAVRRRPFSLLLFDEIEKAHERILDKFLQVLEDGRLTDGRGTTVHFSETLIVFTSNLGVHSFAERHERSLSQSPRREGIRPGMPFEEIESTIRGEIDYFFKDHIKRPELRNRLGDNIIVFNYITPAVAPSIFEAQLANVVARVQDEHGAEVEIDPELRQQLCELCTDDLTNGGRGIGSAVETTVVNPLARALFPLLPLGGKSIRLTGLGREAGNYALHVEVT